MKKIIAYSLWGDAPMYNVGAVENADNALEHYPDWICRYYIGESVPNETLEKLASKPNTEIIKVASSNDWTSSIWRFHAVDNSDVVIFRDTDSRLTQRERTAVNEWLASNKIIHIMRDHPYHTERIMAGMWGVLCKPFMSMLKQKLDLDQVTFAEVIRQWMLHTNFTLDEKGIDQHFLRMIYSLTFNEAFIHDQFPNFNGHSNRHPTQIAIGGVQEFSTGFPVRYKNSNDFVGQVYDENNVPVKEYADILVEKMKSINSDPFSESESE